MSTSQQRDGIFNPTSPHSSSGLADSFKGTPDTRLTAFSPEDGSTKSLRAPHSIGGDTRDSGPVKFNFGTPHSLNLPRREPLFSRDTNVDRDPFVSAGAFRFGSARKLSPTASCFAPSTLSGGRPSDSELTYVKTGEVAGDKSNDADLHPGPKTDGVFAHQELSTDLGISRCVIVAPATQGDRLQLADVEQYISSLSQYDLNLKNGKQLCLHDDKVWARFTNIRDACLFSQSARLDGRDWIINYVHPREFSQVVDPTAGLITAHEGQLTLAVFAPPALQNIDRIQLILSLQELLTKQGDLFAFKVNDGGVQGSALSAIVEYCDNDVSLRAVSELHGIVVSVEVSELDGRVVLLAVSETNGRVANGLQICMALHRPDIPAMISLSHERITSPTRTVGGSADLMNDFQRLSLANRAPSSVSSMATGFLNTPTRSPTTSGYQVQPPYGMMPVVYHGMPLSPSYMLDPVSTRIHNMLPTGNYSWVGPMYSQQPAMMSPDFMTPRQFAYQRGDGRRQNAIRVHRSPYQQHNVSGQHNHVDVDRIREGIDVRTTIMLRNIPNKVDQAMLKGIIDESSWGRYDFMYLRIDFANDCNVGYAFINFVDPLDIIDFVNKRGNQRWNCFKSDKVAEISYATIQGKDCLLYYTINGPRPELAGEEEQFPEPDNQSKMKRSCENAEHVGLFTPNAGQHYRDEQRRRRSQFDRGTRLAAMEEYDYPPFHPRQLYSSQ
ncbi:putative RNA recognition motif 2-domain-containing protein [Seiridium cardinale]